MHDEMDGMDMDHGPWTPCCGWDGHVDGMHVVCCVLSTSYCSWLCGLCAVWAVGDVGEVWFVLSQITEDFVANKIHKKSYVSFLNQKCPSGVFKKNHEPKAVSVLQFATPKFSAHVPNQVALGTTKLNKNRSTTLLDHKQQYAI